MFFLRVTLSKIIIPLGTLTVGSLILSACGPDTSKMSSSALQSLDPAIVDADSSKGESSKSSGNYQTQAPAQASSKVVVVAAATSASPAASSSSIKSAAAPAAKPTVTTASSSVTRPSATSQATAQVVSKSVIQAAASSKATTSTKLAPSAATPAVSTTSSKAAVAPIPTSSSSSSPEAAKVAAASTSTKSNSAAPNAPNTDLPKIKFSLEQDSPSDGDHAFDSIQLQRPQLDQMASVWTDEDNTQNWTEAVLKVIDQNFASFDSAADTETFCPGYKDATKRQKEICWLRIIGGVVYFESHFNPVDYFKEPKTGNLSVGLLSLSPKECDNAPTLESLRNPVANLICGTLKMAQLISAKKYIDGPNHEGAAQYWSTLRPPFDYVDKDRGRTLHLGKKSDIIDITSNYQEFK